MMSATRSLELDQVTFPWEPVAYAHRCNLHELLLLDSWAIDFTQYDLHWCAITKFRYCGRVWHHGEELFGLIHLDMIHFHVVGFVILSIESIRRKNPPLFPRPPPTTPQSMSTMCFSTILHNWQLLQPCAQLPKKLVKEIESHKNVPRDRIIQDAFTSHQTQLVKLEQETGLCAERMLESYQPCSV